MSACQLPFNSFILNGGYRNSKEDLRVPNMGDCFLHGSYRYVVLYNERIANEKKNRQFKVPTQNTTF